MSRKTGLLRTSKSIHEVVLFLARDLPLQERGITPIERTITMSGMKILFAYDGSECADAAINDFRLVGAPRHTEITVFTVAENWTPPPSSLEILESVDYGMECKALAQRAATGLREIQSQRQHWIIGTETSVGSPASLIIEKADVWKPDLIVLGSHGRTALGRVFFGSVSQKVLHEARCSVRIARGQIVEPGTSARLLIGVDGSKYTSATVSAVAARHWPPGSEARLVYGMYDLPKYIPEPEISHLADWLAKERLNVKTALDAASARLKTAGLKVTVVEKDEEPKLLLCQEAESWGAHCIFVGSRGAGRMERFLIGSVSSAVAARAHCSVEVVRAN
jgi:nucleotide-binding universal stress UspA family protein